MKHIIISVILVVFFSTQMFSQLVVTADLPSASQKISIVPQYMFFDGLRLDYEKITNNRSIVFSPQFYYRDKKSIDESLVYKNNYYTSIIGGGLNVHKKQYFSSTNKMYISYGGGYNYFKIGFPDYTWQTVTEDGYDYYQYNVEDFIQEVHRVNAGLIVGTEVRFLEIMFIDFYAGLGAQYSHHLTNKNHKPDKFNSFYTSHAFSGTLIMAGIKLGFEI